MRSDEGKRKLEISKYAGQFSDNKFNLINDPVYIELMSELEFYYCLFGFASLIHPKMKLSELNYFYAKKADDFEETGDLLARVEEKYGIDNLEFNKEMTVFDLYSKVKANQSLKGRM